MDQRGKGACRAAARRRRGGGRTQHCGAAPVPACVPGHPGHRRAHPPHRPGPRSPPRAPGPAPHPERRAGGRLVRPRARPRPARPAVIAGHVDSYQGPGVFFRLGALRPGDQIHVTRADRTVATFRVNAVDEYRKASFPDPAGLRPRRLRRAARHYLRRALRLPDPPLPIQHRHLRHAHQLPGSKERIRDGRHPRPDRADPWRPPASAAASDLARDNPGRLLQTLVAASARGARRH